MKYSDLIDNSELTSYVQQMNHRAATYGHRAIDIDDIRTCILNSRGRCGWCGKSLINEDFEIDHINSLRMGGQHQVDNLAFTCPTCNRRKGTKSAIQFALETHSTNDQQTALVRRLLREYDEVGLVQRGLFGDSTHSEPTGSDDDLPNDDGWYRW